MTLSGRAMLAGVIGWPVGHSRSPRLHGFWLDLHGIDGAYVPLAVRPEHIGEVLAALPKLGFRGANVTVPHKAAALAACREVAPFARRAGAVNTLTVGADGTLAGANTDGYGFLESVREQAGLYPVGPALILGAGGAARSIVLALQESGVEDILVANRTQARAAELAARFGGGVRALGWDDIPGALAQAGTLVNATTLGMEGQPPLAIDLDPLQRTAIVADIVYTPLRTPLLQAAERRGNPVVDGLGMLIHQARPGFRAWFGAEIDDAAVAAARRLLMAELTAERSGGA